MRRFLLLGGRYQQESSLSRNVRNKENTTLKNRTIMPNVHEVRTILRMAVRINRKTISLVAVGLGNYQILWMILVLGGLLAQAMIVALGGIAFLKEV